MFAPVLCFNDCAFLKIKAGGVEDVPGPTGIWPQLPIPNSTWRQASLEVGGVGGAMPAGIAPLPQCTSFHALQRSCSPLGRTRSCGVGNQTDFCELSSASDCQRLRSRFEAKQKKIPQSLSKLLYRMSLDITFDIHYIHIHGGSLVESGLQLETRRS
ncbi:hypothetical protein AVEN_215935-1 [Araneus ventricosus]|uniref:Uncharacterized protein n=1 Tax=Araneus ventricosus TaxID=182803 RepID=A0A4Y2HH58_ARAVE|nr:hypothetical protein AVEN_215935-1 [Araneus ventricosus]